MKIAVFRALQLGDLLVAVPALRALRAGFPHAEITLIGLPWAATFVPRFGAYVDRFVSFPGYPGIAESAVVPARTARFMEEQRAYGYDLVVQMHGSGEASNPFVLALGGRATAGYYASRRPPGLAVGAPYPRDEPEVWRNLRLARLLGCPERGVALEFPLHRDDHGEASALLGTLADSGRPVIGLHPGARPPARRWPAARFAAVADDLARRYEAQLVLTGGPDDEETVAMVEERMTARPLNLASKTSLGGLAAVIDALDLFISNDTGPAHLADALGAPSVTIAGPADHRRWAPLDAARHPVVRRPVACSPCPHWDCPIDHRCLRRIEPADVIAVADGLLTRAGTQRRPQFLLEEMSGDECNGLRVTS